MSARRKSHPTPILAATLAVLAGLISAVGCKASPESLAADARALELAGHTKEAVVLLEKSLAACDTASDSIGCRTVLRFALGEVLREAGTRGAGNPAALAQAARRYREVLADLPNQPATVSALARVEAALGHPRVADRILHDALGSVTGSEGAVLAIQLGDLRRAGRHMPAARDAYRRALELAPDAESAARALAEMAAEPGGPGARVLPRLAAEWRTQFPAVAEYCDRSLIALVHDTDPKLAESALLDWVGLLATRGRLAPGDTLPLPPDQLPEARAALDSCLADPWRALGSGSWWTRSERRANVLAQVALSMGRDLLNRGRPDQAERCWSAALGFAPRYEAFPHGPLEKAPEAFARADLQAELVTLYDRHRDLDPAGGKAARLIQGLFESKGGAYRANDLPAIQRYHTVLGLLYARRGTWRSTAYAHNAVFQLEHALQVAGERQKDAGVQPLPDLKAMLANGYEALGESEKASEKRLEAAEAYLDTDDLDPAAAQLEKSGALGSGAGAQQRQVGKALSRILDDRRAIAKLGSAKPAARATGLAEVSAHAKSWLEDEAPAALPPDFVSRQRFKALADLGHVAAAAGKAPEAARYVASALELTEKERPTLIKGGDLLRVERLETQVRSQVRFPRRTSLVETDRAPTKETTHYWRVSGQEGRVVALSPQALTAARASAVVLNDPKLKSAPPRLSFSRDTLRVSFGAGAADVQQYAHQKLTPLTHKLQVVPPKKPAPKP